VHGARLQQISPLLTRSHFVGGVLSRPTRLTLAALQPVARHVHAVRAVDAVTGGLCRVGTARGGVDSAVYTCVDRARRNAGVVKYKLVAQPCAGLELAAAGANATLKSAEQQTN
jgi:hypothetical protein